MGTKNPGCLPRGTDRPISRSIALSLLLVVTAACGFPRPPDIGGDAAPAGCSRDQDCGSPTPFCVNSACVACRDNTSCPLTRPVCDAVSHDCRTCVKDSECDSGACDLAAGRCVDQGAILYASPSGGNADPCTQTSACSLRRAAGLLDVSRQYIVLQAGRHSSGAEFNGAKATIVGSNATLDITDGSLSLIKIFSGSSINMRNVDLNEHITNQEPAASAAIIVDSSHLIIDNMHSNTFLFYAAYDSTADGNITVLNSHFTGFSFIGYRFIIDSCVFHNGSFTVNDSIEMTNSIIFNDSKSGSLGYVFAVSAPHDSNLAHNTWAGKYEIRCPTEAGNIRFDSNVFYNLTAINTSAHCQFRYNLTTPNIDFGDTSNTTGDPMFKDAANGDFHLKPGSAAVDAANPADAFANHDFDGTPRPQGARSDIGAFEYVPAP